MAELPETTGEEGVLRVEVMSNIPRASIGRAGNVSQCVGIRRDSRQVSCSSSVSEAEFSDELSSSGWSSSR